MSRKPLDPKVEKYHEEMSELTGISVHRIGAIRSMFFGDGLDTRQKQIEFMIHKRDVAKMSTKYKRQHRDQFPYLRTRSKSKYNKWVETLSSLSDSSFELIVKKII